MAGDNVEDVDFEGLTPWELDQVQAALTTLRRHGWAVSMFLMPPGHKAPMAVIQGGEPELRITRELSPAEMDSLREAFRRPGNLQLMTAEEMRGQTYGRRLHLRPLLDKLGIPPSQRLGVPYDPLQVAMENDGILSYRVEAVEFEVAPLSDAEAPDACHLRAAVTSRGSYDDTGRHRSPCPCTLCSASRAGSI